IHSNTDVHITFPYGNGIGTNALVADAKQALARFYIELPTVPGAFDDFIFHAVIELTGARRGQHGALYRAANQRGAFVGTKVSQCKDLITPLDDAYLPAGHIHQPGLPVLKLVQPSYLMLHDWLPKPWPTAD